MQIDFRHLYFNVFLSLQYRLQNIQSMRFDWHVTNKFSAISQMQHIVKPQIRKNTCNFSEVWSDFNVATKALKSSPPHLTFLRVEQFARPQSSKNQQKQNLQFQRGIKRFECLHSKWKWFVQQMCNVNWYRISAAFWQKHLLAISVRRIVILMLAWKF